MRTGRIITIIALAVLGTVAVAQKTTYDYDRAADFAKFKTYAWVPATEPPKDELNHRRIVAAIEAQMAAKALTKVAVSAEPDVLMTYRTDMKQDVEVSGYSSGRPGFPFGGIGSARARRVPVGKLSIEIVNARTRSTVWRSMAARDVDMGATPEEREKNITNTVEKMFKNYPPKS
jgi:hypothetical protein